jgi:hypothetical protein
LLLVDTGGKEARQIPGSEVQEATDPPPLYQSDGRELARLHGRQRLMINQTLGIARGQVSNVSNVGDIQTSVCTAFVTLETNPYMGVVTYNYKNRVGRTL